MNTASKSIKRNLAIIFGSGLLVLATAFASNAFAQTSTTTNDTSDGTLDATVMSTTTATSTATTTETQLRDRITTLEGEVSTLRAELDGLKANFEFVLNNPSFLWNNMSTSTSTNTGTTTTGNTGISTSMNSATVGPQTSYIRSGSSIDFNGRGFWNGEPVVITDANGQTVATVYADGGGNFTTGSLPVSTSPGMSQGYAFRGSWSGMTASTTVNVTP